MYRNLFVAGTISLIALGCGQEMPEDGAPDTIESADKADVVYPYGTWEAESPHVGDLASLTLNTDKSYARTFMHVDCIPAVACQPETGNFKWSHSSTTRYLRFYDADGNFLDRFAWKLKGDELDLRATNSSRWVVMKKKGYAGLGESCGGFVRDPKQCAPGLECVYSGVPDLPGKCEEPNHNPCVDAGGSCVALVPGACDNGVIGDARQYSCGGGLGVECCLPQPAPTGDPCSTASDCTGLLPQFCQVCSDGSTSCAHWTCLSGHCSMAVCK
jgi:hypothetical protein